MNRYHVFLKVIENGSFTKAASEIGYTQSAISQMIQALEEELGTTLISRSRKGIALTPDGEEFSSFHYEGSKLSCGAEGKSARDARISEWKYSNWYFYKCV